MVVDNLAWLLVLKTMKKIVIAVLIGLALSAAIAIVANKKIDERSSTNNVNSAQSSNSELR